MFRDKGIVGECISVGPHQAPLPCNLHRFPAELQGCVPSEPGRERKGGGNKKEAKGRNQQVSLTCLKIQKKARCWISIAVPRMLLRLCNML